MPVKLFLLTIIPAILISAEPLRQRVAVSTTQERPARELQVRSNQERPTANEQLRQEGVSARPIQQVARTQASAVRVAPKSRLLPRRPLPITVKLDQRCTPSFLITLQPLSISPKGRVIELTDGSLWKVSSRIDRRKVSRWGFNDQIVVEYPRYASRPTYWLTNYTRREAVEVNIAFEASSLTRLSHWVVDINLANKTIRLEDDSIWEMTAVSDFRPNDRVVLGLSRDSSGQSLYLMINSRTKRPLSVFSR